MKIIKNRGIDIDDNLKEAVKNAEPGDRILVADLPKGEIIEWFSITNLGAYTVTRKGNLYHNNINIKVSYPINRDSYWKKSIQIHEKNFVFSSSATGRTFVSFNLQPLEKINIEYEDQIISDDGIHFKEKDSFSMFSFSSKKLKKITEKEFHREENCWPIDPNTLKEKYEIPERMCPHCCFETPYGILAVADSPYDRVYFFDQNKKMIKINTAWVSRKKVLFKKDGIVIIEEEWDEWGGSNFTNLFYLYDEILSEKGPCPRTFPPHFSSGLCLKDIMFFDKRGRMQIGNGKDYRRDNQLWFIMKDEDER